MRETPLYKERGVVRLEVRRKRADDGRPVDLFLVLTLVEDGQGGLAHVDGILDDIGDRKDTEKAYRYSEARFRILFDESDVGMVLTDPQRRITRANAAFCRFLGFDEAALWGRDVFDLVHPGDRPADGAQGESGSPAVLDGTERRFLHAAGKPLWGIASWTWFEVDPGEGRSGVVVVQDVTARKLLDEETLRSARLEALGVLAGGMAHDFNNLLAVILGNLSIAAESPDAGPRVRELLSMAEGASLQARDLTQQMLTFAKGGRPVKRPGSLVATARESARLCLMGRTHGIEFEAPDDLWNANFDPIQLAQVFNNLFINALQAMPDGGQLRVEASNVVVSRGSDLPLEPGRHVQVRVVDQGCGIPPELLPRVFEPYVSTRPTNTGLGLAVVHSVIQGHAGHVSVESPAGEGCTFTFLLPAVEATAEAPVAMGDPARTGARPGRILLMDDERGVRDVARAVLENEGYRVDVAADGQEAIEAFRASIALKRPYDAVVLDLTVRQGMGGLETIGHLLRLDPGVRAIVASGYSEDPVLADPARHGFKAVLVKPFRSRDLRAVVRETLSAPT
jgi:PAS domain S-box-containing protein